MNVNRVKRVFFIILFKDDGNGCLQACLSILIDTWGIWKIRGTNLPFLTPHTVYLCISARQVLLRTKISRSLQLQVTVRENVHRLQNDGGSKFNGRWNADENIWRTCMFLFFGGRIATILLASVSSHHFLFPYSISWECPDRRCTSQGGFPPPAVQTPVPLSGNEWSVGWSYRPASHCYSLDVGCFRRVETLSIRMGSSLHFRVWIIFYIFVDTGSHERGQTSRPVVGAEI